MEANLISLKNKIPSLYELESMHIRKVLELCNYNRANTCFILGVSRRCLFDKIKKLGDCGEEIKVKIQKEIEEEVEEGKDTKHMRRLFPTNEERLKYYNDMINRDFL